MGLRASLLLALLPWGVFGDYPGASTPSGYVYSSVSTSTDGGYPASSASPDGGYPASSPSAAGGYPASSPSAAEGYPASPVSPDGGYSTLSSEFGYNPYPGSTPPSTFVTVSVSSAGSYTGSSTGHSTGPSTASSTGPSTSASSPSGTGTPTASHGSTGSSSFQSVPSSASTQKTPSSSVSASSINSTVPPISHSGTASVSSSTASSISPSSGLPLTTSLSTRSGSTLSTSWSNSSIFSTPSISTSGSVSASSHSTTPSQSIGSNSTLSTSLSATPIQGTSSITVGSTTSTLSSSTNTSHSIQPAGSSQSSTASFGSISSSGFSTTNSTGGQTSVGSSTGSSASPTSLSGSSSQSTAGSSKQSTTSSPSQTTAESSGQSTTISSSQTTTGSSTGSSALSSSSSGSSGQSTAESSSRSSTASSTIVSSPSGSPTGSSLSSPTPSASSPGSSPSSTGSSTGPTTSAPESSTTALSSSSSSGPVSITSTSTLTGVPPVNTSIPFIAPTHQVKFDNITYFMPRCVDEPEILWLSDGTNFTLYCDKMVLFNGTTIQMPPDVDVGTDCTKLGFFLHDACFWKRWDTKQTHNHTTNSTAPWCNAHISAGRFQNHILADSPGVPLSDIANKLVHVNEWTCAAEKSLEAVAVRFFNMMMDDLTVVKSLTDLIKAFFGALYDDTDGLLYAMWGWVDQVDQSFLELYCFIDTEDGHLSRIWRGLNQHHQVHRGLNILISVHHVVHLNLIQAIFEAILGTLFWGVRLRRQAMIGAFGAGLQSWTQTGRICRTNYTEPALEHPEDEEPEEDDEEEGWMPRYLIEAGNGMSALAQLRAVEGVLGRPVGGVSDSDEKGPWEIGTSASDVSPSLLVDLQPVEYAMVKASLGYMTVTKFTTWNEAFGSAKANADRGTGDPIIEEQLGVFGGGVRGWGLHVGNESDWGGNGGDSFIREQKPTFKADAMTTTSTTTSTRFYPTADSLDQGRAKQLNFMSRPKSQQMDYDIHRYHSSQGQGTWIFIIDIGFTTAQYEGPGGELGDRQIRKYVVPKQYTIPKGPQWQLPDDSGGIVEDTIEDVNYETAEELKAGHGAMMASVAAGKQFGVASKANLVLIKMCGGWILDKTQKTVITAAPLQRVAMVKAFEYIYEQVTTGGIPPEKSVISIALRLGEYETRDVWKATWHEWIHKLDSLGITIVCAAGNGGYDPNTKRLKEHADDDLPGYGVGDISPAMLVGGVYPDGSVWETTSPCKPQTPSSECFISLYALAHSVGAVVSGGGQYMAVRLTGTSAATAQVAGLAAYFLGYPWPQGQNPFDPRAPTANGMSVGMLMKQYLIEASYQRVGTSVNQRIRWFRKMVTEKTGIPFPWNPPNWVNGIYNYAEGNQRCQAVRGLQAGLKMARDDGGGMCPIPSPSPPNTATVTAEPTPTDTDTIDLPNGPMTTLSVTVTSGNTIFTSFLTWNPATADSTMDGPGFASTTTSLTNSNTMIPANSTIMTSSALVTSPPKFTNSSTIVSANSTTMISSALTSTPSFTNSSTTVSANRTITMVSTNSTITMTSTLTTKLTTTSTPSSSSSSTSTSTGISFGFSSASPPTTRTTSSSSSSTSTSTGISFGFSSAPPPTTGTTSSSSSSTTSTTSLAFGFSSAPP